MQITKALIYTYFTLFCLTGHAQPWTLKKQDGKLEVYSKTTSAGHLEVLAKIQLRNSLAALLILLDDTERGPDWIDHCKQVKILKSEGQQRLVYTQFNAPWPFKDRDMVTYSQTYQDPHSLVISIEVAKHEGEIAPDNKFVRMQNVHGQWLISPLQKGLIEISYQGFGDPAGNIPQWLANKLLIDSTYSTFQNMQRLLSQPQYQDKLLPDIKEPPVIP